MFIARHAQNRTTNQGGDFSDNMKVLIPTDAGNIFQIDWIEMVSILPLIKWQARVDHMQLRLVQILLVCTCQNYSQMVLILHANFNNNNGGDCIFTGCSGTYGCLSLLVSYMTWLGIDAWSI